MGLNQSLPTQHFSKTHHSNTNEYLHQYFLIVGDPSVVIFQGLIDQVDSLPYNENVLSEYCQTVNNNYKKYRLSDEKLLEEQCNTLFHILKEQFSYYFHNQEISACRDSLVELWSNINFREEYYGSSRLTVDPYLVIPNVMEYLKRGKSFNVLRNCFFEPAKRQNYATYAYSKMVDNYPYKSNQLLSFEFFANCFMADTWADVVVVSFALSDYDNAESLSQYYTYCHQVTKFQSYRVIMIFTHPDIFNEKVKLGKIYQGDIDSNIRKELSHLRKDCSLIINSIISKSITLMKNHQDNSYPNRTYEYHIVNTFYDSDLKELLKCLAVGANSTKKCFISSRFNLPPFVIPKKQELYSILKSCKLIDVMIECG